MDGRIVRKKVSTRPAGAFGGGGWWRHYCRYFCYIKDIRFFKGMRKKWDTLSADKKAEIISSGPVGVVAHRNGGRTYATSNRSNARKAEHERLEKLVHHQVLVSFNVRLQELHGHSPAAPTVAVQHAQHTALGLVFFLPPLSTRPYLRPIPTPRLNPAACPLCMHTSVCLPPLSTPVRQRSTYVHGSRESEFLNNCA